MSAEIVLLKHPDIWIETNRKLVVCEAVPDEATEWTLNETWTVKFQMPELHATLEKLSELDNEPSDGERFLLEQLCNTLPEDFEIYYKPVFNGEVIDIVILRKGCGVALISVREWNLGQVTLDNQGHWIDVTSKQMTGIELKLEQIKASMRAKVEHPFRRIKQQFGYSKVRYRGLAKNDNRLQVLAAFSNLLTCRNMLLQ